MPTLLVNYQLHRETLDALTIMPRKHSYHLDVMLVDEKSLWPAWLSVLHHTTRVDTVHATFRLFGACKYSQSGFRGGDEGPPGISWAFCSLLERFLRIGPPVLEIEKMLHDCC